MDLSEAKDKAVAVFGGISVALYLAAIALTPGHEPDSGSSGVEIVESTGPVRDRCTVPPAPSPGRRSGSPRRRAPPRRRSCRPGRWCRSRSCRRSRRR